jgi:uncharacterized protein (DUF427 family)
VHPSAGVYQVRSRSSAAQRRGPLHNRGCSAADDPYLTVTQGCRGLTVSTLWLKPIDDEEQTMKATWNGATLARSDATVVVENNHYFPADSIHAEYFVDSDTHSTCPWKGEASYKTIQVDGQENPDAAWYYPEPKEAAANIKDHYAFWKGVSVEAD